MSQYNQHGRPARAFTVGRMRHRVDVFGPVETQANSGDVTRTWASVFRDEPAEYRYVGGGEQVRGMQVEAGVTAIFTVHFREGYSPKQRIAFCGLNYGIVHIRPIHGRRKYLDLHCKAVDT